MGGYLQLVSNKNYGLYLSDKPEVSFFQSIYKRHTNFSQEHIPIYFPKQLEFGKKTHCKLSAEGDLINDLWLVFTLPPVTMKKIGNIQTKFAWNKNIGYNIINKINITIDDKIIDQQYGEWLCIINELTNKNIDTLIGNVKELTEFSVVKSEYVLHIPLKFWFCTNVAQSLPIICLQQSKIYINIECNKLEDCCKIIPTHSIKCEENFTLFDKYENIFQGDAMGIFYKFDIHDKRLYYMTTTKNKFMENIPITNNKTTINPIDKSECIKIVPQINIYNTYILANYIYLDTKERQQFINGSHDYLIEKINKTTGTNNINIKADNLCKYLIWTLNNEHDVECQLKVNNTNCIKANSSYFNFIIKEYFKTNINKNIYFYPFCIYPNAHQPSGTLNTSMTTISLNISASDMKSVDINMYSVCYNILRINNGIGGLVWI